MIMEKILALILTFLSIITVAQNQKQNNSLAVNSIDGIVNDVLKIVSGKEGKVRDWDAS